MICYVDMEHEQAIRRSAPYHDEGTAGRPPHDLHCDDVRGRLETIAHQTCLVRRYKDITQEWIEAHAVEALLLSGNVTEWSVYDPADLEPLRHIVRAAQLPVLGLCGGFQFIALVHDAPVGPIRELEADEENVPGAFREGFFHEWGFKPVEVVQPDPLFDGLEKPIFLQAHYWEVKEVPEGFELLASTDVCRVQALRRAGTHLYGTQFHPEAYIAEPSHRRNWLVETVYPDAYAVRQPDGRRLLANFFRAAAVL